MIIKSLLIKAFGKFKNKKIRLKPGFNLVYGKNEAGKTTVQTFIQGMFFGFYKPYRKKKTYSAEYEKYMPWEQFDYSGAMVYEVDGKEIRLERNFLRSKDHLSIFDNVTGKNIDDQFKYDGVIRQNQPLGHLGMSSVIYNNTVNMRQSVHATETVAQDEMRSSYAKMKNSSGMNINFNGIIRRLEEKKNTIGRSSQSRSRVGTAVREREDLRELLKESEAAYAKVAENQSKITFCQKKMKHIEAENEYLGQESVVRRKKELLKSYEKINELEQENKRLAKIIKEEKDYEGFNYKTLEGLKVIQNQIERLSGQMDYIEKEISEASERLKVIRQKEAEKSRILGGRSLKSVTEDYEVFKKEQDEMKEVDRKHHSVVIVLAVIAFIAGLSFIALVELGYLGGSFGLNTLFQALGLILIIAAGFGFVFGISAAIKKKKLLRKKEAKPIRELILDKYRLENEADFDDYYKKVFRVSKELEQMKNESELVIVQLSRHQAGFEVLFEQRSGVMRDLKRNLSKYNIRDVAEYAKKCEMGQQTEDLKVRFNANLHLIEGLLEMVNGGKAYGGQELWQKASPKSGELLELGKEIAKLEGENNALTEGVGLPVEIRETIKTLDAQIEACDIEIKACDAAIDMLNKVQNERHLRKAPELNENIGNILEMVTRNYRDVKIDENMKLKVIDPQTGDFKDSEQLSSGTMDQVHFAFRYGIGDITNHDMPFILDEPFSRYDSQRKAQALKLLSKLAEKRQIILFTCDDSEEKILNSFGVSFNKIVL